VPSDVAQTTLTKGSITLNGVSLTVADGPGGPGGNHVTVALIPFTLSQTNLSALAPGDSVNVEADLIGKYVGKMVAQTGSSGMANGE
jgi:riboflavin synthase